jgi:hypothetical protein
MVNSMRSLPEGPVKQPHTHEESLRVVSGFANEMCDVIAGTEAHERTKAMNAINARFADSLQMTPKQTQEVLIKTAADLADVAAILHVNIKQSPFASRLRGWTGSAPIGGGVTDAASDEELLFTIDSEPVPGFDEAHEVIDAEAILAAGIQDISNSLVDDVPVNDILRIILETIYRAMGFEHVLLCLRDGKNQVMSGRFGFGPDSAAMAKHLRFPLAPTADVFHVALSKGVDVFISDIDEVKIAERIPSWYRQGLTGKTFVLLPLSIKSMAVAMIYCSKAHAGTINISEKELSLLKTLRNQAILAIKQAS